MTPGERVTLIRQLAEEMAKLEYTDGDLMLRQFGFRWSDQWPGNSYGYYVAMLEDGEDDKLLALHKHIFGFSGEPAASDIPEFWRIGGLRVFISHLATNKKYAADLKVALLDYGMASFVAHEDIEPTKEWVDEIERALLTCDALVALLTPGFKESNWTDQEVGFAHGRRVLIVSVRQGVDPYGFISRYQAVNGLTRPPEDVAGELVRIFARHPKTAAAAAEGLVTAFERSGTFAQAKYRVAQLQHVETWTPDLLRRIEQAVSTNSQIESAWGVPGQVQQLLAQHSPAASGTTAETGSPFDDDDDLPV